MNREVKDFFRKYEEEKREYGLLQKWEPWMTFGIELSLDILQIALDWTPLWT